MPYISPTIQPSGTTWAQLRAGGFGAELNRVAAANNFSPAIKSLVSGNFHTLHQSIVQTVDAYLRGDPVSTVDVNAKLLNLATALKAILAAMEEVNVLISANPGTLTNVASSAATGHQLRRVLP